MKIPDGYIVRLVDLPASVGGLVSEDETGTYNIYINARHGYQEQRKSLEHELEHIQEDDLHNAKDIRSAEK